MVFPLPPSIFFKRHTAAKAECGMHTFNKSQAAALHVCITHYFSWHITTLHLAMGLPKP